MGLTYIKRNIMRKHTYIAALLAASLLLCSCASDENVNGDNSFAQGLIHYAGGESAVAETQDVQSEAAQATTAQPAPETESAQPAESAAAESAESAQPAESAEAEELGTFYSEQFAAYKLTDEERAFIDRSVFVGDSICRGFSEYKVVSRKCVYARGSLAARSFFDYAMYMGDEEVDFATVLERRKPQFVFLSMGMNDINLTDEETYCENYRAVIDAALKESGAQVYVCAITPINSTFSSNYHIDCYNLKLQAFIEETYPERVHFVDFAKHLKDADGNLKECFNGGDGIHLAPYAYYVALWEMNRTLAADGFI